MATKTQAQVLLLAQRKLNELNANRFSEPMLRGWINEGCDDIARRTQGLRASSTISAVAGTQQYTGPTDALAIHAVRYTATGSNNPVDLEYTDYKNAAQIGFGLTSNEGTPAIYWTWGYPPSLELHIYPVPSQAGALLVHYYKQPTPLATESTTDQAVSIGVPQGWEDAVVDYVVCEAMLSDRDQRYTAYQQKYEAKILALADTSIRYNDQMGMITVNGSGIPRHLWDFNYD